jgi:hypothetical protein
VVNIHIPHGLHRFSCAHVSVALYVIASICCGCWGCQRRLGVHSGGTAAATACTEQYCAPRNTAAAYSQRQRQQCSDRLFIAVCLQSAWCIIQQQWCNATKMMSNGGATCCTTAGLCWLCIVHARLIWPGICAMGFSAGSGSTLSVTHLVATGLVRCRCHSRCYRHMSNVQHCAT